MKIKIIPEKLREFYLIGLTKNQRILAFGILALLIINIILWLFSFKKEPENTRTGEAVPNRNVSIEKSAQEPSTHNTTNPSFPRDSEQGNSQPSLPEINNNEKENYPPLPKIPDPISQKEEDAAPGPMDNEIANIKEEYKNNPNYNVILGYLSPLKEIADGKRAWNELFRLKAEELFGAKKAREIESENHKS